MHTCRTVWLAALASLATVSLISALVRADEQPNRISAQPTGFISPVRYARIHARIHDRILARKVVRKPSRSTVDRMVNTADNRAATRKGRGLVRQLEQLAGAGKAKRGTRHGYGATDVQFKARGLARSLGLSKGQSVSWNTRTQQQSLRVESSGRVVLTSRPHDRYMTALRGAVNAIVARLAADPQATLSPKEQRRLAMAPTDMRAEALQKTGMKLTREERGSQLKYRMEFKGERGQQLYSRVFGPTVSTYLPGGHHSQYLNDGKVLDTFFKRFKDLRPTTRVVYPVMLSINEAENMDLLAYNITTFGGRVQGGVLASGRPKGYWPPRPTDKCTGNTCTTTHHRAPVGPRQRSYAWLDRLDSSGLVQGSLLRHISQSHNREAAIDRLLPQANRTTRKQLRQLKGIVQQYNKLGLTKFPLELLGRKQLKDLLGTPFQPSRKGTTDPVGPGFARPLYSSADERVPLVVKFKQ